MSKYGWLLFMLAMTVIPITSCHASRNIPVNLVYDSLHCPLNDAGIYSVTSATDLENIFKAINSKTLGGSIQKPPEVDFKTKQIFIVSLGTKPNAGYRLLLEDGGAVYIDGELVLPVVVMEPADNMLQAQVITTPCMLLSVPKNNYKSATLINNNLPEMRLKKISR